MNLQAIMTLNATGFTNPLAGVRNAIGGTIARLTALAGGVLSVGAAVRGVKTALDFGGKLSDLSNMTGVAVRDLVVLRQAFEDTGVGAENVRTVVGFLQRSLSGMNEEGGRTAEVFQSLGLNMDDLRKMSAPDQITAVGKAINGLGNESDKTAAVMAIFGRAGASMKSFFADPEAIETARKSLGSLPAIMERNAGLFDAISDQLGRIKAKSMGLFGGIAQGVAPALKGITDAIDGIDFAAIGEKIGNALGTAIEIIRSGRLWETISLSLTLAFKSAVNFLATGLLAAGKGLMALLMDGRFWKGIAQVWLGYMTGALGILSKLVGADQFGQKMLEASGKNLMAGISGYGSALKNAIDTARGIEPIKIFDTDAEKTALGDIWAQYSKLAAEQRSDLQAQFSAKPEGGGSLVLSKGTGAPKILSDALARIGGYVGGGGIVNNDARRTAIATEKTNVLLDRFVKAFGRQSGSEPVAVWG